MSDRALKEKVKEMIVAKKARTEEVMLQMLKHELKIAEKLSAIQKSELKIALRNSSFNDSISPTPNQASNNTSSITDLSSAITPVKQTNIKKFHFNFNFRPMNNENSIEKSPVASPSKHILIASPKTGAKSFALQSPKNVPVVKAGDNNAEDAEGRNGESDSKLISQRHRKIKSLSVNEQYEKIEQERKDAYFHKAEGFKQQIDIKKTISRHLSEASLLKHASSKEFEVEDRFKKEYNYDGLNLMTFLTPKTSVFAMQKANLERKFKIVMKKYEPSPGPTAFQQRQESFLNKSERDRIIDLCKILKLKDVLPSKQQDGSIPDFSNRPSGSINPELSTIISSLRKAGPIPLEEEQPSFISNKISLSNRLPPLLIKHGHTSQNSVLITSQREQNELPSPVMSPIMHRPVMDNIKANTTKRRRQVSLGEFLSN